MASQFIAKFFKHFPNLADAAIDASLDLCEDENIQIRRQAIRDLPLLCKETKEHIPKIGDILAQLLVVDDQQELQQVHMSLQQILKIDAKQSLAGIVSFFCSLDIYGKWAFHACFFYFIKNYFIFLIIINKFGFLWVF